MSGNGDFKVHLAGLIDLQEIDSEIYDLNVELDSFPGRLKEMDDILLEKTGGLEQSEERLKRLQLDKGEKENAMLSKEEKIKKHEGDLYLIKNNKEYSALQLEIDSIKADVSILEEEIISILDEIEAAVGNVDEEKKIFEDEKASVERQKQDIKAEEKRIIDDLKGLKQRRDEISGSIPEEITGRYEKILENRGKVGITSIEDGFCGVCKMLLRAQVINEVMMKKDIVICESCGRILYAKD